MKCKQLLALLLALAMLMSMAACGTQPEAKQPENSAQAPVAEPGQTPEQAPQEAPQQELSREDQELIADLIGGEQNADQMSDEALDELIDQLIKDATEEEAAEIVNLGGTKEDQATVDNTVNKESYDENGAMTKPFDQVYPDLIENGQVAFSDESLLIKLENGTLTDGLKAAGIGALEVVVPMKGAAWYEAKLLEGVDPQAALAAVRQLGEVLLAEYNYEIQTAELDDYKDLDDAHKEAFDKNGYHKDQWYFHHCGIPDGYTEMETSGGDSSVVVAVIDSGVDYDHEDLKDNMWVNAGEIPDNGIDDDGNGYIDDYYGVDLIAGKGNGDDDNGHGTHVAGIIAARNNNIGVVGIAYNVKIMAIKAAMHNGTLNQADIARAVLYAYEMGAEVINMSFGGTACSIAVQDALATAYTRCVLVASAGNSGMPNEPFNGWPALPNYPAALTYVLGVMSVDAYGAESIFTNWDAYGFNGVEYELYAPGENIMSTLPGDRYGLLSGTSMAAPVVSAMAAILRSEFTDRDMYPTKFIYGQLASTSDYTATCGDPQHGLHSLPQVVNLNAALTKMPNPEVSMQDFTVFDSTDLSEKNNGDGVIDAGETIALGLTLRNRWGMSENTVVSINTLENGISDPYVEILNDTVNYGSVGTYSTQDCGKIMDENDQLHIGWEDPFLIKIADNCPNDYRMTFHVTITCENALDEADETIYVAGDYPPIDIDLNVRNGVILPSIIDEDMVLTKENLYIIPDSTVITEGTTVRVEPGTHIQFWSDDPNDAYAENALAYLLVNGTFLVEGTAEEPVYIYPSELMDAYNVEMGQGSTGYISLKYADISNLRAGNDNSKTRNRIAYAERCTFRNIYGTKFYSRYLNGTVVSEQGTAGGHLGTITEMKDCVFYKLGAVTRISGGWMSITGDAERCIFVECGMLYGNGGDFTARDCVFLGNNFVDQMYPDTHGLSTLNLDSDGVANLLRWWKNAQSYEKNNCRCYYNEMTGTTYIHMYYTEGENDVATLLKELGGGYAVIETAEELEWMLNKTIYEFRAGITYDEEADTYLWSDGTALGDFILPMPEEDTGDILYIHNGVLRASVGSYAKVLYEIPGPILPTDITFKEYTVDMDPETIYQLAPMNTPVQLPADCFFYESSDENVVTVSQTGLVTPVGLGTADVWVWSLDKAIKNRVTFTVREYVALEGLSFPAESVRLQVGTTMPVECVLTPADTTRRNVTYTTSDPSVVTVESGVLTAVGKGSAVITATCEGVSATMTVNTWVRANGFAYKEYNVNRTMESCDTSLPELLFSPENADLDLQWTSTDETVVSVEDGKFVMKKTGYATLKVKDLNSGMETKMYVTITSTAPDICADVLTAYVEQDSLALPEFTMADGVATEPFWEILDPAVAELQDGQILVKGAGITTLRLTDLRNGLRDEISIYVTDAETPKIADLQVRDAGTSDTNAAALLDNGDLYVWQIGGAKRDPVLVATGVKAFDLPSSQYDRLVVLLSDNRICNYRISTVLVDGVLTPEYTFYQLQDTPLKDLAGRAASNAVDDTGTENAFYGVLHVVAEDGTVYAIGDNAYGMLGIGSTDEAEVFTKVLINEPVVQVVSYNNKITYYLTEAGNLYVSGGTTLQAATPIMIARNVTWLDNSGIYFTTNGTMAWFKVDYTEPTLYNSLEGYTVLDINAGYGTGLAVKDGDLYKINSTGSFYSENMADPCGNVVAGGWGYSSMGYVVTEDGQLFGVGQNYQNVFLGMTAKDYISGSDAPVFLPLQQSEEELTLLENNLSEELVLSEDVLTLRFNKQLLSATVSIAENGTAMVVHKELDGEYMHVCPTLGFVEGVPYTLTVSASGTSGVSNVALPADLVIEFVYQAPKAEESEEEVPEDTTEEPTEDTTTEDTTEKTVEEPVVYEAILDETVARYWTADSFVEKIVELQKLHQVNSQFQGNAILNQFTTDDDVTHWLRPIAPTLSSSQTYQEIAIGGNWWGTTNEKLIEMQMVDYVDYKTYSRFMYAPYLTEAPENTFPFVTSVTLYNKYGEAVTTVGNEEITFRVTFNRDMDTSIPLQLRFGSAFPYGDYEIEGAYVDARTWEGTYTLNTLIENGLQFFTIENGCSATDDLALQQDRARFGFIIDTSAAQALIMQGHPTDTGIELTWTQDDFDTLMGYNVYRSNAEDGLYTRLNSTVIPAETMTWFDDTVEPGVQYYYNFTVVQTDLTESEPSGKIVIMSKDTMAPDIYHSPVVNAFTGANLIVSATVTDNLSIAYANLYYRVTGTDSWKTVRMNKLNDKYSAIIPAADVTVAGIEYYIEAFDGVSYTCKGSAETPYAIAVQEAVDANALGDVDGDGAITNRDALILLYAINDKYNMTTEEFARADLNGDGVLWAAEALRILQYVSGTVGSLKMS